MQIIKNLLFVFGYVPYEDYEKLQQQLEELKNKPRNPLVAFIETVMGGATASPHKIITLHRESFFEIAQCEHCDKDAFGVVLEKKHRVNEAFKIIIESMSEVNHTQVQSENCLMVHYAPGTDAKQFALKVAEKTKSFYA